MTSIKRNLTVDQGATFTYSIPLINDDGDDYPANTTGWSANAMMKRQYSSNTNTGIAFTSTVTTGNLTIAMSANVTNNANGGVVYVYDVELTSNTGVVTRIQEGLVTVAPSATR